jgi:hypothetical protein
MNEYKYKTIEPKNIRGHHGYQEWYGSSSGNNLWLRGMYKNDQPVGYVEDNPHYGGIGDEGTVIEFYIR